MIHSVEEGDRSGGDHRLPRILAEVLTGIWG